MTRQRALLVLLVVAVALAGCGSAADSGGAATPTPDGDRTPTTAAPPDGTDGGSSAAAAVVAASRDVEEYHVDATVERTMTANNRETSVTVESAMAFDRTARELALNRTQSGAARTVESASYVTNGTYYQRRAAFESQYGSEWIRQDVSENLSETWSRLDTLARQRALLENASVTVAEETTVNGTDALVLHVDGNESAYEDEVAERLARAGTSGSVTVHNVSFTMTVATDTDRLLRSTGTVSSAVSGGGATLALEEQLTLDFRYAPVDVSLPPGAETAVTPETASA